MSNLRPDHPTRRRPRPTPAIALSLLLVAAACGGEDPVAPTCETDASLCPSAENHTAEYLAGLPSWQAFAQPDTVLTNELDVTADTLPVREEIVDSIPVFGNTGSGIDSILTNVRYVCQARPYTLSDAPERIVMFDPNRGILYPGALLQGKSRKELGAFLPLTISQRRPIRVSIPDLPTGANFRDVAPTQGAVDGARGEMIGDAVLNDLATPTSSTFEMETYHSERSFALSSNLSGRYLGFEVNASGSIDRDVSETTVTAHFYQRMYTVVVERPAEGFFNEDFTDAVLEGHVAAGRLGPDNLPIYVSEVVFGRMMMFSVTSTASESDIRAAMSASYNTFTGGAGGGIDTRKAAILENSKIAITAVGGSGDAAAAMIQSGDWSQYFASSAKLSEAVPLSYTFTNVGDGSIAAVTEATNYSIDECQPKPLIPGTFDFTARQDFAVPLTPGYQTLFGDANADGREDLFFTYRAGSINELAVALAQGDGTFAIQPAQDATVTPAEGWSLYNQAAVGDLDGDGDDDILWNRLDGTMNAFYVALSNGDGTFTWGDRFQHALPGWSIYTVYLADVDNADGEDIVWNGISGASNRTYVARAQGDGTFDMTGAAQDKAGTCCWNGTELVIADVTGDGFVDLIHNRTLETGNSTWVSIGAGDGTFGMSSGPYTLYSGGVGWDEYELFTGDINHDFRTDLFWTADARTDVPIHRGIANANGTFTALSYQHVPDSADAAGPYEVRAGDVDADGDVDVVMVDLDSSNNRPVTTNRARIWVGLGTVDQIGTRFDFTPIDQLHPAQEAWGQFRVHVADVNADDKDDLLLYWNSSPYQIYVGLAK